LKRCIAIVNPKSNHGRTSGLEALQQLVEDYQQVEWLYTTHGGHAIELAQSVTTEGCDLLMAVGGDGTLNEVVNGMLKAPETIPPPLAVIPIGSGNDFVSSANLPRQPAEAIKAAFEGEPQAVDAAYVEVLPRYPRYYWINSLGLGLSSAVTVAIEKYRYLSGMVMYVAGAINVLFSGLPQYHARLQFEDSTTDEHFLMLNITNGRVEGGGIPVTPDAVVDDGLLDYTITRKMNGLRLLRFAPAIMFGRHLKHERYFSAGKLKTFSVETEEPLVIHADGEILARPEDDVHSVKGGILPGALQVMRLPAASGKIE